MQKTSKIYISGHRGLVGSHLLQKLKDQGYENIITKTRVELDLLNQAEVLKFFEKEKPDYVFLAAAKVGGIMANMTQQGAFLYENLQIQNNVIHSSYQTGVKKLLFLGSSCIYPRNCPQPMREEYLMTGDVEPTNYGYAIAKIAGLKMCQAYNEQYGTNYITVMPTNLYGPGDNFDPQGSHVLPALIRKFATAVKNGDKEIILWGTGTPKREFLHAKDLADACVFLLNSENVNKDTGLINIGVGADISILELANLIKEISGFQGNIVLDTSKPDGMMRKLLDVSKISNLGWKAKISIEEGIKDVYNWFIKTYKSNLFYL
ncbi:GDP-L-fucose synthase family protein [Candidatus Deianiraea vastatrix]|uniref:GDP-L-fucose synthase n=1 Tax=Candidatus Deianiraea vastatrix TaxID=2163644 RepID=A0A5B8XIT6_9RICK|nr:GDP-L-fucose synthase [Candidatus Deianiraea vastatrix]QED23881.1 GDP-L-fucose synthase [Candidatus Deianiraea vastatrix]